MEESLSTTLKGQIAVTLLGIACSHYSMGNINFAFPFVDDQGIDLIFFKKGSEAKVMLAQVKSRTEGSQSMQKKKFRSQIRIASFRARRRYFLIFITLSKSGTGLLDTLWLIPSLEFEEELKNQKKDKVLVFDSSFKAKDMWAKYRLNLGDLPNRILYYMEQ